MTDHHDFADHFGDDQHDPMPYEEPALPDDHLAWHAEADDHLDLPLQDHHFDLPGGEDHDSVLVAEDSVPVHEDISDIPEVELSENLFPPAVDVGELPEPVDGFPWIDSGSLGLADIQAALHEADTTEAVQPAELAEYAATDLPPGADPWAALAGNDDPATAALARWWSQN
jgi:hypothetical protein